MRQLARVGASGWTVLIGLWDIGTSVNLSYVLGAAGVMGREPASGMGIRPLCFRNLLPVSEACHSAYIL